MLETIGTILGLANSAKSLFGGSGGSESSSLRKQYAWNIQAAKGMPSAQVEGLRAAGLNPMLALGMGGSMPSAPPATISPGKDADIATARTLATATAANQAAQSRLFSAQTENVEADTLDKLKKPALTEADTKLRGAQAKAQETLAAWQRQLEVTEGWNTKVKITEHWSNKLKYELDSLNLPSFQKQQLRKLLAEANSATTKADLDKSLMEIERLVAIGAEGVGAITGGLANSARALFGNKPKTIIQKAPNITIKNK